MSQYDYPSTDEAEKANEKNVAEAQKKTAPAKHENDKK